MPESLYDRAELCTSVRLLCAVVNEGLVTAQLTLGNMAIINPPHKPLYKGSCSSSDGDKCVFVFTLQNKVQADPTGIISYLDPDDVCILLCSWCPELMDSSTMEIYNKIYHKKYNDSTEMRMSVNPCALMKVVAEWNNIDLPTMCRLFDELTSSVTVQHAIFLNLPPRPSLISPPSAWERAINEGHATCPMHRTRYAEPPLPNISPYARIADAIDSPNIVFFSVPRDHVHTHGSYMTDTHPRLLRSLGLEDNLSHILFPVHEFQIPMINKLLPKYELVYWPGEKTPIRVPGVAQASLRTVEPVEWGVNVFGGHHVKLSLGITTTSSLRTISNNTITYSPLLSTLAKMITVDNSAIKIIEEVASIGIKHDDPEVSKYMGCIIRMNLEYKFRLSKDRESNEKAFICAGLVERDFYTRVPNVIDVFRLHTQTDRIRFLTVYTDLLFSAVLPALRDYGFAFEAHGQNSLLRIVTCDNNNKNDENIFSGYRLVGIAMRDYGGVRLHSPTFENHLNSSMDEIDNVYGISNLLDQIQVDSWSLAESLEDVYKLGYHTTISCHIHRLVRALELHHSGVGWTIVRTLFSQHVPNSSPLYQAWTRPEVELKCFVKMKCQHVYRDCIYQTTPNVMMTTVVPEFNVNCAQSSKQKSESNYRSLPSLSLTSVANCNE